MLAERGTTFGIRWDRAGDDVRCHHQKSWLIDPGQAGETAFVGGININPEQVDQKSFKAGALFGDAVLYELATAKYLGGFAAGAISSEEVNVHKTDKVWQRSDLSADLTHQFTEAFRREEALEFPHQHTRVRGLPGRRWLGRWIPLGTGVEVEEELGHQAQKASDSVNTLARVRDPSEWTLES